MNQRNPFFYINTLKAVDNKFSLEVEQARNQA